MSGYQNVQRPMFAPQSGKGDDFDLNDLFADYFVNEMDDPLKSFGQTMAASMHPGAASLAQQQLQQQAAAVAGLPQSQALPTGRGIKTAFHAGAMPNSSAGGVAVQEPVTKKHRVDMAASMAGAIPAPAAASKSGGISGRLGFSMLGGQLAVPQRGEQAAQEQLEVSQQQAGAPVSLPVGVGIRIGGGNGAVSQAPSVGGVGMTHTQWGASGAGQLAHVQHGQAGTPGQYQMWGSQGSGGAMTEQAVAERRQRNREHAKRSRVRKKFMLESLQQEVRGLQKENEQLRMLVQSKVPSHAQDIINECCSKNPLFEDGAFSPIHDLGAGSTDDKKEKTKELVRSDFSLITSLTSGQQNFVLSDPRLPDNPIVYASEGFYELTGYSRDQVLGRNCRFLQGPGTDPKAVDVIRTAIANGSDATTCLLNYKADGTPFWNQFFVAALRDQDNCIVNYVGVQCAIDPESGVDALEDKVNAVMPLVEKDGDSDDAK